MKKFASVFLLSAATAGMASTSAQAQPNGVTTAQAERGAAAFNTSCSTCHGQNLAGGPGTPSLVGPEFMFEWKQKTPAELQTYIKTKMPPGSAGGLSDQQYADIVAYIRKANEE